ncbi:MAG: cupin domain-containing protein [Actinobacteria bacterium]|nr:cupin domain-containing protein [Actinomycetota bacterium]
MDILNETTSVPALGLPLHAVPGDDLTALAELGRFGGPDGRALEVGIWEMAPGTATDVEADELFVVIAGRAVVDFTETGHRLELAPGDVVRLSAGDRTVWTVSETLRKVYLTAAGD